MRRALVTGANRGIGLAISKGLKDAGHIDVLVNNAGILGSGNLLDDPEDFAASMAIMVHGPYLLMHSLTPRMNSAGYGRVVNVSSGCCAFLEGVAGPAAYGMAKAALNALTVASARTLPRNVKVNAMCPGWVRTRMGGGANRSPEEGADTAIWLATLPDDGPTGGFYRDRMSIAW